MNLFDEYDRSGLFSVLPLLTSTQITAMNLKGKLVATAFRDKTTNTWSYKLYSYDYLGRVKDLYTFFQSTTTYKKISNEYDNLGNLTKQNVDNQFYTWYSYDEQARLKEVRSNMHNAYTTAKLEAIYTYDLSDKITKSDFKSTSRSLYQTYSYDTKGRLDDLYGYRSTGTPEVLFREDLGYFDNDNVSSISLVNKGNVNWANLTFNYTYDDLNRLISSSSNTLTNRETYTYDNDGNLLTRVRPNNTSQSLSYHYAPDGVNNYLLGLTKGTNYYYFSYDYKGNMISDTRKSITSITYDRRNLPIKMTKTASDYYDYNYDDAGNRIYKRTSTSIREFYLLDHTGKELAVYDLITGRIKMLNLYGNGLIGKVNVTYSAGTTQNPLLIRTDSRQYYFKDHLGSIRQTLDETATVVSAQDYYPFGGIMENRSYVTGGNVNDKYKFTEKERDVETNYDYFGARYYDSELGRWLQVDPLADKYPGWSPYNYTLNNPLRFIDPDGKEIKPKGKDSEKKWAITRAKLELTQVGNDLLKVVDKIPYEIPLYYENLENTGNKHNIGKTKISRTVSINKNGKIKYGAKIKKISFDDVDPLYNDIKTSAHELTHIVDAHTDPEKFWLNNADYNYETNENEQHARENAGKAVSQYEKAEKDNSN